MLALTIRPGLPDSIRLEDVPDPPKTDGPILVRTLALGLCGTDREIVSGVYGTAPTGEDRLVLGHESLGEVLEAPRHSGFTRGDLVVGIVRRPDPVPCPACAADEWDMCRNGQYTERGIKESHGFGSEWFRIKPEFAVKIDPSLGTAGVLLEPASIVAKAWDHIERIGSRTRSWQPRTLLVTGAGPIGLLAAMAGVQRGLEVQILERVREGLKLELIKVLGAKHYSAIAELEGLAPDITIECTGSPMLVRDVMNQSGASGIICLTGVSDSHHTEMDIGSLNRKLVLENRTVFGVVNANRRHYADAGQMLAAAKPGWLSQLISRRVPLSNWRDAFEHRSGDIKVVIDFTH
jgi:threonine dehydrogenase-like Zn-dependent dehydrogenase